MTVAFSSGKDVLQELHAFAPAGFYIALRVSFAFPLEEINALPEDWIRHYAKNSFMLVDPTIRWAYANSGLIRWHELQDEDTEGLLQQARNFGMAYGVTISFQDELKLGVRSFGSFARNDRDFSDQELAMISDRLKKFHLHSAPPDNITEAELEALQMVKDGQRLKQIAHELGVTEGAVKQRLKNAKLKLGASTSAQAASLASTFGLI